jgi:hypothetical protein
MVSAFAPVFGVAVLLARTRQQRRLLHRHVHHFVSLSGDIIDSNMKTSTKCSLALCASLFTTTYSSNILLVALSTFIRLGIRPGTGFFRGSEVISYIIGDFVGPLVVWSLSAYANRKLTALISLCICGVAGILAATAMYTTQAIIAGAVVGLSHTMMFTVTILWQTENADAGDRARKLVLLFVALAAGRALAQWISFALASQSSYTAVRVVAGSQILLAAATAALLHFLGPESYR